MRQPRLVLCSGAEEPGNSPLTLGHKVVELHALGDNRNVNLLVENVSDKFESLLDPIEFQVLR